MSSGITISTKNLALWITVGGIIIGSIVDSALTRDQVRRNKELLEKHNLELIDYKLTEIEDKVDGLDGKMDQVVTLVTKYIENNPQ